jgi:AcrR family transcriptional regulator
LTEIRNKREQRADRNRKKLLMAAMRLFSQKGYHKATLDEICKRARLGKGTIYQHFENKKDLFLGIVDSLSADLGARIAEAVEGIQDDVVKLQKAVLAYMGFHTAHRGFYRLLIHEESSFSKEIHERFRSKCFSHLRILEEVLRGGMESKKLKKTDARSATFALVGMCNFTIFRWIMSEKPYPLDKEVGLILEIFLRGITRGKRTIGA